MMTDENSAGYTESRIETDSEINRADLESAERPVERSSEKRGTARKTATQFRDSPRVHLVLARLAAHGGSLSAVQLARDIAAYREASSRETVTPQQTRRMYLSLHAGALADLSRRGLIEYKEDVGTVQLTSKGWADFRVDSRSP